MAEHRCCWCKLPFACEPPIKDADGRRWHMGCQLLAQCIAPEEAKEEKP